ncbi:hypothetical protein [uncultured Pedobacter sp.]|uniref:hypothetical protein n=1 Tax=uncultured Pedobacter sp. TaxID=246139 RepID=UPI0025FD1244|nr:hypothetical protein [uncultured Pedobacter sp.]
MRKNSRKNRIGLINSLWVFIIAISLFSCKKKVDTNIEITEAPVEFSYEVTCNYCDISYIDIQNQSKTIKGIMGKWAYKMNANVSFDLKLSIKTSLVSAQEIQAYILRNDEAVYGIFGYNYAEISYDIRQSKGISSFGNYIVTGTGNNSGGNTNPVSSVCGAKNKTGGYCKRIVVGGGRCWQHK